MSTDAVNSFFESAYNDRSLQGSLHLALAAADPDVVVEIAKNTGHEFTSEELQSVVGAEGDVEGFAFSRVSAPTSAHVTQLSRFSMESNFWSRINRVGGLSAAFELTIPGPSFVNVMGSEGSEASDTERPSAVELYESL
jgi:hypothetical protein